MNKSILILLILQLFSFSLNQDAKADLHIARSQSYSEQTGSLTPLVVELSSEDKNEKIKGVDLICVVDISGSMVYNNSTKLYLVKESLKYLVKLMNENDKLAIVAFNHDAYTKLSLTQMTEEGKNDANNTIDKLEASGGTDIFLGLKEALKLITNDYASGERVASMILLTDGYDLKKYADTNFKNHINILFFFK